MIFENLQTDDSLVEKKTLTRIQLLKFQASRHLFSNPQLVQVTAIGDISKCYFGNGHSFDTQNLFHSQKLFLLIIKVVNF